jgi:hypothetical protein
MTIIQQINIIILLQLLDTCFDFELWSLVLAVLFSAYYGLLATTVLATLT